MKTKEEIRIMADEFATTQLAKEGIISDNDTSENAPYADAKFYLHLGFSRAYTLAQSKSEWVDVNDRLPEIDYDNMSHWVIGCDRNGSIFICFYSFKSKQWVNDYNAKNLSITHWMHLPIPHKIKQNV